MTKTHRDSIFLEDATVLAHQHHSGGQYTLRLHAPQCAAQARPGNFVHLNCGPGLAMRRPFSIMRCDPQEGWVDFLYKAWGGGTFLLTQRRVGEHVSLLGPIGMPFVPDPARPRALLLGGGVGIPPMIFLAETLRAAGGYSPVVFMGSEIAFPFESVDARITLPGLDAEARAAMPLMEDWGIPSRLASQRDFPGVFRGYITQLAEHWLAALTPAQRAEVMIFACGPHPMLEAIAQLAREHDLPCQVSMEEFMACAVGGCAGCTIEVQTESGPAMKRVCVDGPVFDARMVFA
jgi:dihydroorotate dehydrogenase electron transfer subunit